MSIGRWEPFREMISLRDVMDTLLEESFVRPGGPPSAGGTAMLPLDVAETEDEFVVKASLPGVKPDDVHITVHDDTLTIRGKCRAEEEKKGTLWHMRERRASSFARSLCLGARIDADAAVAQFDHGILTLTLPKSEEARPRQIKVTSLARPAGTNEHQNRDHQEQHQSGTGKHASDPRPSSSGGRPETTHAVSAEQARESQEAERARNAVASNRERMVDIGRGNQQAGRQGQ